MYPLQCYAGFGVPVKVGKMEIVGISAAVNNASNASQFAIVDGNGELLNTLTNQKDIIVNLKGMASVDSLLSYEFSEPLKTRRGISVYTDNLVPGSIFVYVR